MVITQRTFSIPIMSRSRSTEPTLSPQSSRDVACRAVILLLKCAGVSGRADAARVVVGVMC